MNYGTARDWARLGQLCLARGEWNGQRLVPAAGYIDFMATPAPAWLSLPEPLSDFHHLYGGGCWLNRATQRVPSPWALPEDAYNFAGAGGQRVFVVPSLDLVVVRHGHMRGGRARPAHERVPRRPDAAARPARALARIGRPAQ